MFDDEMLTIEEVAGYLKLKPQTIYKWAQTGKIPGAKFGKEWRFKRSLLEQWIDGHMTGGSGSEGVSGSAPKSGGSSPSSESDSRLTRGNTKSGDPSDPGGDPTTDGAAKN